MCTIFTCQVACQRAMTSDGMDKFYKYPACNSLPSDHHEHTGPKCKCNEGTAAPVAEQQAANKEKQAKRPSENECHTTNHCSSVPRNGWLVDNSLQRSSGRRHCLSNVNESIKDTLQTRERTQDWRRIAIQAKKRLRLW